ncbi:hypothetical protein NDN08_007491 [Rhodosorus marinus]|uniref:Bacterial bifunctional deaminase-reductase C-terminal domain-containing protein n=1 Tax=Rhodosorus marinus TaxID=101924 RepID=A0AAV8V0J4_9RHOD|nr:hypothetical protein NDN08_007491 [Rhodosorus marinus]
MMNALEALRRDLSSDEERSRPFVTVTFAQSLDGSIAAAPGERTPISGNESMVLTHQLRAMHEAILVGVNTVISDDPQLSVRLCAGSNPQPVVLDSSLRIPESCALMTSSTCKRPTIMTSRAVSSEKRRKLQVLGATILQCDENEERKGLDLKNVLFNLRQYGSVMVEGGREVISTFLRSDFTDRVLLTIAPKFLGGMSCYSGGAPEERGRGHPKLQICCLETIGGDIILLAKPEPRELRTMPRLEKLAMAARRVHLGEKLPRGILITLDNALSTDSLRDTSTNGGNHVEDLVR